jgi:hypothetical protein
MWCQQLSDSKQQYVVPAPLSDGTQQYTVPAPLSDSIHLYPVPAPLQRHKICIASIATFTSQKKALSKTQKRTQNGSGIMADTTFLMTTQFN